ncbi:MAG: 2TM domain-containing protein [Actinomycetota bacterium]|nr:2TM domain-containing protein [Actinomycetota bacterium]MDD5667478.1 2TM domain-containing protein [Actinomycetota bacterium]
MVEEQQPPGPPLSDELREKAEKRVNQKMALYSHIGSYIIVNGFLVLIWALTGADTGNFWPVWVMLGWGIGLAFHIFSYFIGKRSDKVRERMLQKEMDRINKEQEEP